MTSIIPETTSGGVVVRDAAGACQSPVNVSQAYCPDATFTSSCAINYLPNDCTARITAAQINAFQSEMLCLGEAFDPDGNWNCGTLCNLSTLFLSFRDGARTDATTLAGRVQAVACASSEITVATFNATADARLLACDGSGNIVKLPNPSALPADGDGYLINDGVGNTSWVPHRWTTANRPAAPFVGQTGFNTDATCPGNETWTGTEWKASELPTQGTGYLRSVGACNTMVWTPHTWETATRPAVPFIGQTGYNSTLGFNEVWNGMDWGNDHELPTDDEGLLRSDGAGNLSWNPSCWDTAGRPALPYCGQTGYNSTLGCNEYWTGALWQCSTPLPTSSEGYLRDDGSGILTWTPSSWTTAGRPVTPFTGQSGYNTALSRYEYWNGVAWTELCCGASAGPVIRGVVEPPAASTPLSLGNDAADFYFDEVANVMYFWDEADDVWIAAGGGATSAHTLYGTSTPTTSPTAQGNADATYFVDTTANVHYAWDPVDNVWFSTAGAGGSHTIRGASAPVGTPTALGNADADYYINTATDQLFFWDDVDNAWLPAAPCCTPAEATAASLPTASVQCSGEYWVDSSGGVVDIATPTAPSEGCTIHVYRQGANNVTITGTGTTIGTASQAVYTLDLDGAGAKLVHFGGNWKIAHATAE